MVAAKQQTSADGLTSICRQASAARCQPLPRALIMIRRPAAPVPCPNHNTRDWQRYRQRHHLPRRRCQSPILGQPLAILQRVQARQQHVIVPRMRLMIRAQRHLHSCSCKAGCCHMWVVPLGTKSCELVAALAARCPPLLVAGPSPLYTFSTTVSIACWQFGRERQIVLLDMFAHAGPRNMKGQGWMQGNRQA